MKLMIGLGILLFIIVVWKGFESLVDQAVDEAESGVRLLALAGSAAILLLAGCGGSDRSQPSDALPRISTTTREDVDDTAITAPQPSRDSACDLFSDDRAAALLKLVGDPSNGPDAETGLGDEPYFTGSVSECYRLAGATSVIVAVFDEPNCDFENVSTDPTRQVSTSPNVFVAGSSYACGELTGGHAVALIGGALDPTAPGAAVDAAWVEFFTL